MMLFELAERRFCLFTCALSLVLFFGCIYPVCIAFVGVFGLCMALDMCSDVYSRYCKCAIHYTANSVQQTLSFMYRIPLLPLRFPR